jgi:hypothetical protein
MRPSRAACVRRDHRPTAGLSSQISLGFLWRDVMDLTDRRTLVR